MKSFYQLLLLMGLSIILLACSDDTPPVVLPIAELCTLESGTKVLVEGSLDLPTFLNCKENQCQINFHDGQSSIFVEIYTSERPKANMLQLPPEQYTLDDLSVVLNDGTVADRSTKVAITGRVKRPSANVCYLDASSLALP